MERQVLFKFPNCRITSYYKELTYDSETYQPGLLITDNLSASGSTRLNITRETCALLDNEPVGANVDVKIIDRDDQWSSWRLFATHLFILEGVSDLGFGVGRLDLAVPEAFLSKAEVIIWSDEYARRKYGNQVNWFRQISEVDQKLREIEINDEGSTRD